MKFFLPNAPHPATAERQLTDMAKVAGVEVPERRIRTLFFTEDGHNRSASVGKPFRKGERAVVAAILPHFAGGYAVFLSHPDDNAEWRGPVVVPDRAVLKAAHFSAPAGALLRAELANAAIIKRADARQRLFAKVDRLAKEEDIDWSNALRKITLDPKNAELVATAQEPRKPRKPRTPAGTALREKVRLPDAATKAESDTRFRALYGRDDDICKTSIGSAAETAKPPVVRKADGTVDEEATAKEAIKKIHKSGGTVERRR